MNHISTASNSLVMMMVTVVMEGIIPKKIAQEMATR
jgi:hypothetical protein